MISLLSDENYFIIEKAFIEPVVVKTELFKVPSVHKFGSHTLNLIFVVL